MVYINFCFALHCSSKLSRRITTMAALPFKPSPTFQSSAGRSLPAFLQIHQIPLFRSMRLEFQERHKCDGSPDSFNQIKAEVNCPRCSKPIAVLFSNHPLSITASKILEDGVTKVGKELSTPKETFKVLNDSVVGQEAAKKPSSFHSSSSQRSLEESIKTAVEAKNYQQIPDLLSSKEDWQNPNPFLFLSTFTESHRTAVVDEILQSLILIRPRSQPHMVYSCLLSYILESKNPLPLALAIIQRMLRSGCLPVPQTHLLLSQAWGERRQISQSVSGILLEMQSIGYSPDCGTCNYLILSLCKLDQIKEALKILREMGKACLPDLDSYGTLIGEMSELRMTSEVVEIVKEMVRIHGLYPRRESILKALDAMRANKDMWRGVDVIEYLEREDVDVGFETYELALEGCLEGHQFVLAGKLAIRMTERGYIPYIEVRQRVVEGLVSICESELALVVRQRFADM